jgi:cyclase
MEKIRIIPRLDVKGPNIVKGIHAEGLRVVGEPREMATRYYQEGADELLYLDIVASLYQRSFDFDLLSSVARSVFIPLTVGGGIRSLNDITNALHAGADKVAINTYAIAHPEFLAEAVKKFGAQCIVAFVEAKQIAPGRWEAYTDGGREKSGVDVIEWVQKAVEAGVGEILVSSIDRDGTRKGFDHELLKAVMIAANVPVIAHGGAGSMDSVRAAAAECGVSAVSCATVFHYKDYSIPELKAYLRDNGVSTRI